MTQTRSAGRAPGRAPRRAPTRAQARSRYRDTSSLSSSADESDLDVVIVSSDDDSTASDDDAPLALRRGRPRSLLPASRSHTNTNTTSNGVPHLPRSKSNQSSSSRPGVASSRGRKSSRQTRRNTSRSPPDPTRDCITVGSSSSGKHKKQQKPQKPKRATTTLQGRGDNLQKSHPPPPGTPNWLDLRVPYDCWVSIFSYASCENGLEGPNTGWLLSAATTCRAFAEPSLTAIYRCPVLRTPSKAKRLAALLERSPAETLFNYRAKIESLYIDIHIVPQALLYRLIQPLFRLRELVIFTTTDQAPYRKLETNVRWNYTEDIFKALLAGPESSGSPGSPESPAGASTDKPFPTVLKSWEWSGRLLGGHVPTVDDIARIHQMPSFAHLTRVSFTNFQLPSAELKIIDDDDIDAESMRRDALAVGAVARALSELKSLKHLVFESSTVMDSHLFPLLPDNLHHLELINCWSVESNDLAKFLRTRGRQLRTLSLLHNQSLSLEFVTDLADACPNLQVLNMNMSCFHHPLYNDDACYMYDEALLVWQIPKWPSTLRVLHIENIRGWREETAEMFLESIAGSSDTLPDLRHLFIKTMLDIPWQARAELRNKWRLEMERIFLRQFIPPLQRKSLRDSYAMEDEEDKDKDRASTSKRKRVHSAHAVSPSRRSSRIADVQAQRDVASRRARGRGRPVYREPATDDEEFDVSSDEESASEDGSSHSHKRRKDDEDASHVHEPTIQGLCNTVHILFDNQKPMEVQFGMEDFLDAEASDREWNGDDDDDDDDVAF